MATERSEREQSHIHRYGCFFKSLGVLLVSALMCGTGVGGCVYVRQQVYQQQLAMAVERIRVSGEPLDGSELNAFYKVPENEIDLTALYLRALAIFVERPAFQQFRADAIDLPIVGDDRTLIIPPVDQDWPEQRAAEAFLLKYKTSLDLLHEAGQQPGSVRYPIDLRNGAATLLPHAQAVRGAARLLSLEIHVRLHQQDHDGATQSLVAMVRAEQTLKEEPIMVSQLVRMAVLSVFEQDLRDLLEQGSPTQDDLARLQAVVAEVDFPSSFTRAMQGERAIAYQTLIASDLRSLAEQGGRTAGMELDWLRGKQTLSQLRPGDSAMILISLTEMIDASKHPFPAAAEEAAAASSRLTQFFADDQKQLPWDRHVLTQLLLPAVDAMVNATAEHTASQRSALAVLAVERFRLSHEGQLPQKLDGLVPKFLEAIPTDPSDGQPLRFRLTEQGYVVYSVGPDKADDHGDVGEYSGKGRDVGIKIERAAAAE